MVGSMSICTARAWPVLGRNSAQGKPVPIISRVSQSSIMSDEGLVPNRPMVPVTQGRVSGSTALPSRALAAPALQLVGQGDHLVHRAVGAGADQQSHLASGVQHLGGALQLGGVGHHPGLSVAG